MQRALPICACLLWLPFLCGCIVPFAYPALSYTPRVQVDAAPVDVHAFRVDLTSVTTDVDSSSFRPPAVSGQHRPWIGSVRLSRVPITTAAEVPAQIQPSVSYGLYLIGVALNYPVGWTRRTVAICVYRPGFELVEIRSGTQVHEMAWRPVQGLAAEERVLDELFSLGQLEPKCNTKKYRDALDFGASEYERLSNDASDDGDHNRLIAKARGLRGRAHAPGDGSLISKGESEAGEPSAVAPKGTAALFRSRPTTE